MSKFWMTFEWVPGSNLFLARLVYFVKCFLWTGTYTTINKHSHIYICLLILRRLSVKTDDNKLLWCTQFKSSNILLCAGWLPSHELRTLRWWTLSSHWLRSPGGMYYDDANYDQRILTFVFAIRCLIERRLLCVGRVSDIQLRPGSSSTTSLTGVYSRDKASSGDVNHRCSK
jgi:hypothetical protein